MKKVSKVLLFIVIFALALIIRAEKSQAAVYIWPVGGNNANETYKDYDFYGKAYSAPYKNGKSGREYIVNNKLWPNEKYYYSSCESHYGMDITGIYGNTYTIVSVCDGNVIATSGTRASNPGVNYIERNQRRTSAGLRDGGGYGNYVIIEEPSTGRCFLYAHLKGGSLKVNKGDTVKAGQEIATMGSSGDSGHMHLHFEIRKSRASTIRELSSGKHYLVTTTSYTNYDPEQYVGTTPNVHTPVSDTKIVQISGEDARLYVRYLYNSILGRNANEDEIELLANKYINTGSICEVTKSILFGDESNNKNGELSNLDFVKKTYEVVLHRGNNYTEQEMAGHVDKLNRGIWDRNDYMAMLCNCPEFSEYRCKEIINMVKEDDTKKAEEEQKRQEEEKKKQEEEEQKRQEEEKKKQEEEEQKRQEEEKKKQEEEEQKRQEEEEKKKQEEEEQKRQEEEKKKQEEEEQKRQEQANYENAKVYVRFLYRTVLNRKASDSEVNNLVSKYKDNLDIAMISKEVFVNSETENMTSYEFMKKIIVVLFDKNDVSDEIINMYANQIESGAISRSEFVIGVCSTNNFKSNMYQNLVNKQKEYEEKEKNTIPIASKEQLKEIGDLNGDGYINAMDASLCIRFYLLQDKTNYEYAVYYADVDGDGQVHLMDAMYILSYSAEIGAGNPNNYSSITDYVSRK